MVCDFVCILSVITIEFISLTSSEELSTKAAIAKLCVLVVRCIVFVNVSITCIMSAYNCDTTIDR